MATATIQKGDFVREVLGKSPEATFEAVNEAWTGAGHGGSISRALVNKMRSKAGLSGNRQTKAETKKQATPAVDETPVTAPKRRGRKKSQPRDQGKTPFVKEFLNDYPEGNVKAVNEAWANSGFDGSISPALVNKMRASLGLTGNLRGKKAAAEKKPYTGKKRGRKPKGFTAQSNDGFETHGFSGSGNSKLIQLEADVDRLVFKVMGLGNLPEIEHALRQVRRQIYARLTQG
jgi:hypothetical protein